MSLTAVIFVSLMTTAVGPAQADQPSSTALPVSLQHIRKALETQESTPRDPNAPKLRLDAAALPVVRPHLATNGEPLGSPSDDPAPAAAINGRDARIARLIRYGVALVVPQRR